MKKKTRRGFLIDSVAAAAAAGVGAALVGCNSATPGSSDASGSDAIASDSSSDQHKDLTGTAKDGRRDTAVPAKRPSTTVRQRIDGVLPAEKQSDTQQKKLWGVTHLVAGASHKRVDSLNADSVAGTASGPASSLLYMAHFSDVHVIDEESPARAVTLDQSIAASWRTQEAYACQVLDAMVRKVHKFDSLRKMDLVLFTGDAIESNQKNELTWFLKVLNGGAVWPNSGAKEDPVAGLNNDPHDSMVAAGMGAIPWYMAMGNHDLLIAGNLSPLSTLGYSPVLGDPTRSSIGDYDLGRVNPPVCNPIPSDEAPTPRCIPTQPGQLMSGTLPADADRAYLSREKWVEMVAAATGSPAGHGFAQANVNGDYVVTPVAGLPLRLVVMNSCASIGPEGAIGNDRLDGFLVNALNQARDDKVLVIFATHHPSDEIIGSSDKLRSILNGYPNVILHLVGHGHVNSVIPRPGVTPELGYWEVQTCALCEWPQQGRLVEIVDKRNGTAEIWLTMFDFDTEHQPLGSMAAAARFFALYEIQSGAAGFSGAASSGRDVDRNVILPVALTPELRQALAAVATKPIESALFA